MPVYKARADKISQCEKREGGGRTVKKNQPNSFVRNCGSPWAQISNTHTHTNYPHLNSLKLKTSIKTKFKC